MHFSFHLDTNISADEARRISAAVLALGGVTDNAKQVGELTVAVKVDTKDATEALGKLEAHPAVTPGSVGLVNPSLLRDPNTVVTPPVPQAEVAQLTDAMARSDFSNGNFSEGTGLDVHGLPWDDRIHSSSRARNADGSWRAKRGVQSTLVTEVEAELRGILTPNEAREAIAAPPASTFQMGQPRSAEEIAELKAAVTHPPAPPVPPIPAAVPPVPSATPITYANVVNLIMSKKWSTEMWWPVIGESLPAFAATCQKNPAIAGEVYEKLQRLDP